ncbi:uncharacterized protein LOC128802848 isoform X3 [Vidua macroura]|uniref:uncharacterized protein LOC128802848 isoform X3 n=1 Tax=Vidua macroura TaxID=187451 RepID=UPI0023A81DA7|nr:uncharacterized protein LOC128802848 isoform X3 [Vidua macroura]
MSPSGYFPPRFSLVCRLKAALGFEACRFQGHPELLSLPQLEDLKNELEKRQAKKNPEISHQDSPAQGQEEKNQQLVREFCSSEGKSEGGGPVEVGKIELNPRGRAGGSLYSRIIHAELPFLSLFPQEVKSSISRCGKVTFQLPLDAAPGPEERVYHFSWRSSALKETLRKLQAPPARFCPVVLQTLLVFLPHVTSSLSSLGVSFIFFGISVPLLLWFFFRFPGAKPIFFCFRDGTSHKNPGATLGVVPVRLSQLG